MDRRVQVKPFQAKDGETLVKDVRENGIDVRTGDQESPGSVPHEWRAVPDARVYQSTLLFDPIGLVVHGSAQSASPNVTWSSARAASARRPTRSSCGSLVHES